MKRFTMLLAVVGLAACQQAPPPEQAQAGPAAGTPEWKVQNAMSAAPDEVSRNATIMDWPANEGEQPTQLRAGSSDWVCFPDQPPTPANDPLCADKVWQALFEAWMGHKPFSTKVAGIAYMLQGGAAVNNTDPFKMAPDSGESWMMEGPHVMLIEPNPAALAGLPDQHLDGAPYVMWKGTPYVHVMVPVK